MASETIRRAAVLLKGSIIFFIPYLLTINTVYVEGCLKKVKDDNACFIGDNVIQEGGMYMFPGCLGMCSCINGLLHCDDSYQCSSNEVCQVQDNTFQCICDPAGFERVGDTCVSMCSNNELYGTCTCEISCENPQVCVPCTTDVSCFCPTGFYRHGQNCVLQEECGCFEDGVILSEGERHMFPGCLKKCSCINGSLHCDDSYQCTSTEVCQVQDNTYQCICDPADFERVGDTCVSICSNNELYGTCTCEIFCENPQVCIPCTNDVGCYCPPGFYRHGQDCVRQEECGCFIDGFILPNGHSYVNSLCTQQCTCINDQLNCFNSYKCSPDAECVDTNSVRHCVCNDGYTGNGLTCTPIFTVFTDCYEAYQAGNRADGVYKILPLRWSGPAFDVYCDMATSGGGWTVFQRRTDGITDFYRGWDEYKTGFGSTDEGYDFWLGNEQLHYLTDQEDYRLRIDLVTSSNQRIYAEYTSFVIGDEDTKYELNVTGYSGDARDGLDLSNGKPFSTHDQDNDECSTHNYAESHKGGWWYTDTQCGYCSSSGGNADFLCNFFEYTVGNCDETIGTYSNLNGDYNGGDGENIFWAYVSYRQCNLNSTEMKIRPSSV